MTNLEQLILPWIFKYRTDLYDNGHMSAKIVFGADTVNVFLVEELGDGSTVTLPIALVTADGLPEFLEQLG